MPQRIGELTRRIALLAAFGALVLAPLASSSLQAARGDGAAAPSKLAQAKARTLAMISPYRAEQRWESYRAVSALFDKLWRKPVAIRPLREANLATLPSLPLLRLEDRDGDGAAEFFSYLPGDGTDHTQEFGAFFDLDGNGRPDWLVYYGGLAPTKQLRFFLWHHYLIDTNGDGRFDIRIFEAIDSDGDGLPEEGVSTWLIDVDHDGLVDRAERMVGGRASEVAPVNGALPLGFFINPEASAQPGIGTPMPVQPFETVADDIEALLKR